MAIICGFRPRPKLYAKTKTAKIQSKKTRIMQKMTLKIDLDEHDAEILRLLVIANKDEDLTAEKCATDLLISLLHNVWANYTAEETTPN